MNTATKIELILELLDGTTVDERKDIIAALSDVYCTHCWRQTLGNRCYCLADE